MTTHEVHPGESIQAAIDRAEEPGDLVYVKPGVYEEELLVLYGSELRIRGDQAVIVGGLTVLQSSNVQLSDLVFAGASHHGITVLESSRVWLENVIIDGAGHSGVFVQRSGHVGIRKCRVSHCAHGGIVLWYNERGDMWVEGNLVHDIEGRANWDGIQGMDTPRVSVRWNMLWGVGREGDFIDFGGDQDAPESLNRDIQIVGNTIHARPEDSSGGIKLNNRPSDCHVRRNTLFGAGMIFYEPPYCNVWVYQNRVVQARGHALQFWNFGQAEDWGGIRVEDNDFIGSTSYLVQHGPEARDGGPKQLDLRNNRYVCTAKGIDWAHTTGNRTFPPTEKGVQDWIAWQTGL